MVPRTKWIERKFNFDFPAGLFPCILERLRGTPARLEEIINRLPPEILTKKPDNGWSIQENVGHLIEVEALHLGRLDDYDAGAEILAAADMKNVRTNDGDYNEQTIGSVFIGLREVRRELMTRLEAMSEAEASRVAQHPRLDVPMRVVDMAYFAAEHDDFHVAVITELARALKP